jgi:hypothetical protein
MALEASAQPRAGTAICPVRERTSRHGRFILLPSVVIKDVNSDARCEHRS